jgi:hypothetical protein
VAVAAAEAEALVVAAVVVAALAAAVAAADAGNRLATKASGEYPGRLFSVRRGSHDPPGSPSCSAVAEEHLCPTWKLKTPKILQPRRS